ncbi:MAG: aspartate aminotransferase family protein [Acidimicrobiia bacterium]
MHSWDERTDLLAHSVLGYAVERLRLPKDTHWGARPATELEAVLDGMLSPGGVGGHEALRVFRDVLVPACRPMDDPMMLSYVPTAPTFAATLFDLVVSASSIFAGHWESGAGAIAAENQALAWLAELAGFPPGAGGCFVSGGSAANLSALVTGRHHAMERQERAGRPPRWAFAATSEVHASVKAAARVMDVDVLVVPADEHGRMTGASLSAACAADPATASGLFAVVASAGTTNVGALDDLAGIADVCAERQLWLHVDGAYGGAALCAPSARPKFAGIERSDSFSVDPHKWLFAPYDAGALVYREPSLAAAAHAQHGDYLDAIDRGEWNPADYGFHLSRRARGLPLWFSLVTHGTDAYRDAVETTLATAHAFADDVRSRPEHFELLLEPDLSVVLFRCRGWRDEDYRDWTRERARDGTTLIVPTRWEGETCYRVCVINPRTSVAALGGLLDDMAIGPLTARSRGTTR